MNSQAATHAQQFAPRSFELGSISVVFHSSCKLARFGLGAGLCQSVRLSLVRAPHPMLLGKSWQTDPWNHRQSVICSPNGNRCIWTRVGPIKTQRDEPRRPRRQTLNWIFELIKRGSSFSPRNESTRRYARIFAIAEPNSFACGSGSWAPQMPFPRSSSAVARESAQAERRKKL